jgi:dihydroorotate dehydrogenase electron transfer subunit
MENPDDRVLPRPFSIHDFGNSKKDLELGFLYRVVGTGTRRLTGLMPGQSLSLLAPLGNGFPNVTEDYRLLLAAGGMGIAALYPVAGNLKTRRGDTTFLYGARSRAHLVNLNGLLDVPSITVKIATEDGSQGIKGMVTDLLEQEEILPTVIYACGPPGMLQATVALARQRKWPCYVSLEERMACGIGACLGCAVRTRAGYLRVCKEGPVFDAEDVIWE